jgi:predicted permease
MEGVVITLCFLLIGMAIRRLPDFPAQTGLVLNLFVIYITMPALILIKIPTLDFSRSMLTPLVMPWVTLGFSALAIGLIAKLAAWPRATTGCLLMLIPLGNTSFFGFPMVKAFFGEQALSYAVLYDQLGSFMALSIYGSTILAIYGSGQFRPRPSRVARKIILFPPFIALVIAFGLRPLGVVYPPLLTQLLNLLAGTLVPLVMVAVGFQLELRMDRQVAWPLGVGLTIKLLAAPAAAWAVCRGFGLEGEAVRVSIFEAGMPPMITAGAMAIAADLSPRLAAALVGIGMVASCVTLPIVFYWL